uniref:RNA-guided endonuclease InsQ/TnpB family protein n=1 Tax=Sporosarcina sp. YIM B06819 TaxID=3081769 RepID=UPI00298C2E7C
QKAGLYFVSVLCEVEEVKEAHVPEHDGIGIDLGINTFAVCSHHVQFDNINKTRPVIKLEKSLKRQQRKLSRSYEQNKNRKRGDFCAKNRQKQLLVVQKLHARLANIRQDYIRYVVSVLVKTKPTYLTIEDLNLKGMKKNRYLSRAIAKQNFSAFREMLTDKCLEKGIELRLVDRWYPSSKLCSTCGVKKTTLSLSERTFSCDNCDTVLDRDFNASLNLKYAKEYTIIT